MTADYWDDETVGRFEWDDIAQPRTLDVRAEVPMSKVSGRLPRFGNRYYPTMVSLDLGFIRDGEPMTSMLLPENARSLAAALTKAADLADGIDAPDSDTCGHWAPCDCAKAGAA